MRFTHSLVVFLAAAAVLAAEAAPPAPSEQDIKGLIAKLGSDDFAEREAATSRLDEIGAPALAELRLATRSDNPEVVRRARELLRAIEGRAANEKTLAPTLVELDAKNRRLDDVLADLSKQAGCEVVLNGLNTEELANRRITVATGGKVPFWEAVLRVCEAGKVQVAVASGFLAPGAMPLRLDRPRVGVRPARNIENAIALEASDSVKRRPAAVFGAVLVEAIPLPKNAGVADAQLALLQVWPEPRLKWQANTSLRVAAALAPDGSKLTAEPLLAARPSNGAIKRGEIVVIRNPDGSARFVEERPAFDAASSFNPNVRQAVLRFKAADRLEALAQLDVSLTGTVRSAIEPLCHAGGLEPGKPATGAGIPDVEMIVLFRKNGKAGYTAEVTLGFDRRSVHPAGVGEGLPGTKGGGPGLGNQSVQGVRITDATGKPYTLGLNSGSSRPGSSGREVIVLNFQLYPDKDGNGPPAAATFWGSYAKPVQVPILLKDVPLSNRKIEK